MKDVGLAAPASGSEPISDVRIEVDYAHLTTSKFSFTKLDTETMRPGESMTLHWWRSWRRIRRSPQKFTGNARMTNNTARW